MKRFRVVIAVAFALSFVADRSLAILPPQATGDFYVGNFNGDDIGVYDSNGVFLRTFTAAGLNGPRGLVFAPNGRLYVASENTSEIFVFDSNDSTHAPRESSMKPNCLQDSKAGSMALFCEAISSISTFETAYPKTSYLKI